MSYLAVLQADSTTSRAFNDSREISEAVRCRQAAAERGGRRQLRDMRLIELRVSHAEIRPRRRRTFEIRHRGEVLARRDRTGKTHVADEPVRLGEIVAAARACQRCLGEQCAER